MEMRFKSMKGHRERVLFLEGDSLEGWQRGRTPSGVLHAKRARLSQRVNIFLFQPVQVKFCIFRNLVDIIKKLNFGYGQNNWSAPSEVLEKIVPKCLPL